ncbi:MULTISPECIES: hypothetical protein [unclassified Mycobacterium]|uniref:hypothetical protein n=1 Tax=unclassified Mycobacterium TaxID=2642494 RepID=UPI0029C96E77|nr:MULTISPECIES: hypothetical protein [unclassified Mycobacterium]
MASIDAPVDEPEEPQDPRSDEFGAAWSMLDDAAQVAQTMASEWNALVGTELFRSSVYLDDDGAGQVDVLVDEYEEHRLEPLERAAREFIERLLLCGREALRAAERCVSGPLRSPDGDHLPRFPFVATAAEFLQLIDSGALSGLRPDQIQLIEQFQPYYRASVDDEPRQVLRAVVTRLMRLEGLLQSDGRPVVAFSAHSASPMVEVDLPATVTELQGFPDGVLVDWHRVATFRVPAGTQGVRANPNIAFDPILNAEPWPDDPDDNMSVQVRALLCVVEELIRALERSVGLRSALHGGYFRFVPLEDDPVWTRIDLSETPEIEAGMRNSELGLATYRSGDEVIMLVQRLDGVYARLVPAPVPLDPDRDRGPAAEEAARDSASLWGLPDFVFQPETVQRGNATREVGDGTIVCGNRGLAVQVKARTSAADQADRERSWIIKKAREGARQAAGSVRTVQRSPLAHTNLRGRSIILDGNEIEWVGVVIIDHDSPPEDLSAYTEAVTIPHVVVFRKEWEFLFDQLRSTTAVVDYFHRIADHHTEPGEHVADYYELALADEQAGPDLTRSLIPTALRNPAVHTSHPILPVAPASAADEYGARMYRQMLEDIAESSWDRDESQRVHALYLLDNLPVAERATMGRRLLTHLGRAPQMQAGSSRWDFRRYLLGNAYLHLAYAVCNQFTDLHKEAFKRWVMLRHHEWTNELEPHKRDDATTVAVLLTPRHDRVRPWDTSVFAAFGDLALEPDDLVAMQRLWNNPQNMVTDTSAP